MCIKRCRWQQLERGRHCGWSHRTSRAGRSHWFCHLLHQQKIRLDRHKYVDCDVRMKWRHTRMYSNLLILVRHSATASGSATSGGSVDNPHYTEAESVATTSASASAPEPHYESNIEKTNQVAIIWILLSSGFRFEFKIFKRLKGRASHADWVDRFPRNSIKLPSGNRRALPAVRNHTRLFKFRRCQVWIRVIFTLLQVRMRGYSSSN